MNIHKTPEVTLTEAVEMIDNRMIVTGLCADECIELVSHQTGFESDVLTEAFLDRSKTNPNPEKEMT